MSVEEGEDLLRISSEVVVAILEASSRVLNPDHFLLFGSKHIEGFLRVFRVLGPCVVSHLNGQVRHRDCRRKELRGHVRGREGTHLQQLQVDEFLILGDSLNSENAWKMSDIEGTKGLHVHLAYYSPGRRENKPQPYQLSRFIV